MGFLEIGKNSQKNTVQANVHQVQKKETLYSISKKYGVTVDEIMKYNGLKDGGDIKAGQTLKIPPKTRTEKSVSVMPREKKQDEKPKNEITILPDVKAEKAKPAEKVQLSASGIASELKLLSKKIAAVNREDFQAMLGKVNEGNVVDVIKAYDRISPRESLIDMICSEIGNSKEDRKNAVKQIVETLYKKVGTRIAPEETRAEFLKELEDEFDSLGFVSTKKMDNIINGIVKGYDADVARKAQAKKDKRVVRIGDRKTTSGVLRLGADSAAVKVNVKDKRPDPLLNKNGNIVANVKVIEPMGSGDLNGKTIIVNAGHGGYNPNSGAFDAGTRGVDKDGKTIEEWRLNDAISKKLIPLLSINGAKVIYMNGSAANIVDEKAKYNADLFISIHCDSAPNKPEISGQSIIFNNKNGKNSKLAGIIEGNLERDKKNINNETCKTKVDDRGLGVLTKSSSIPSLLIETGFLSNEDDLKKLTNENFQQFLAQNIAAGIGEYFKTSGKTRSTVQSSNQPASAKKQIAGQHKTLPATVHEIKSGETLSALERKYGLRAGELAYVNKLDPQKSIKIGQKIRIPERYSFTPPKSKADVARILGYSQQFIQDIIDYEGTKGVDIHKVFPDSVGNPTIGYGHLLANDFEKKYYKNRTLDDKDVYTLLTRDLIRAENSLRASIGDENFERLNQSQRQAVVDFVFSRGIGSFNSNSCKDLRAALIDGDNDKAAANLTYNRSVKTAKVMNGLTKRRLYEMAMFAGDNKSGALLKAARKLYNEGLKAGEAEKLNKGTMDAYKRDVNKWFDGKLF